MPKCNFNKVACNFIEIVLQHGRSLVNLLHIFRARFPQNTCGWLFLSLSLHSPDFCKLLPQKEKNSVQINGLVFKR